MAYFKPTPPATHFASVELPITEPMPIPIRPIDKIIDWHSSKTTVPRRLEHGDDALDDANFEQTIAEIDVLMEMYANLAGDVTVLDEEDDDEWDDDDEEVEIAPGINIKNWMQHIPFDPTARLSLHHEPTQVSATPQLPPTETPNRYRLCRAYSIFSCSVYSQPSPGPEAALALYHHRYVVESQDWKAPLSPAWSESSGSTGSYWSALEEVVYDGEDEADDYGGGGGVDEGDTAQTSISHASVEFPLPLNIFHLHNQEDDIDPATSPLVAAFENLDVEVLIADSVSDGRYTLSDHDQGKGWPEVFNFVRAYRRDCVCDACQKGLGEKRIYEEMVEGRRNERDDETGESIAKHEDFMHDCKLSEQDESDLCFCFDCLSWRLAVDVSRQLEAGTFGLTETEEAHERQRTWFEECMQGLRSDGQSESESEGEGKCEQDTKADADENVMAWEDHKTWFASSARDEAERAVEARFELEEFRAAMRVMRVELEGLGDGDVFGKVDLELDLASVAGDRAFWLGGE